MENEYTLIKGNAGTKLSRLLWEKAQNLSIKLLGCPEMIASMSYSMAKPISGANDLNM